MPLLRHVVGEADGHGEIENMTKIEKSLIVTDMDFSISDILQRSFTEWWNDAEKVDVGEHKA